jgi:hypothetical protein
MYNQTAMTSLIDYWRPFVQNMTSWASSCQVMQGTICYLAQQAGETCNLSYPTPLPHPVPSGFKLLGYVLDVNVKFNNNIPISIESVSAASDGNGLPINYAKSNCPVHCSFDVNVTLNPVTAPTHVTLAIDARLPVMWFMWGDFGMIHKTIVVSLTFVPSDMSVQFG